MKLRYIFFSIIFQTAKGNTREAQQKSLSPGLTDNMEFEPVLFLATSETMMGYHDHTQGHTSNIHLLCEAYALSLGLAEGKAHGFYSFNKAKI